MTPKVKHEWCVVGLDWPNGIERLRFLHGQYLPKWKVVFGPVGRHLMPGVSTAGGLRNALALLAGNTTPNPAMCVPLGVGQLPAGKTYLQNMHLAMRTGLILIPNGSIIDAAPFPLLDFLELNGADELYDGGSTVAPFEELIARLKAWFEVEVGPELLIAGSGSPPPVVRCDRTLNSARRYTQWDANSGFIPPNVKGAMTRCPELYGETCTVVGRRCDVIELARSGHVRINEFIDSRPTFDLMDDWFEMKAIRKRLTIAIPEELELR